MYLISTGTQSKSDFWLVDFGASFHMTPHREWFYEYERYNGNSFLGDSKENHRVWKSEIVAKRRKN